MADASATDPDDTDPNQAGPGEAHHVMASVDYPMVVVTAADGDGLGGCLVGFHTQCSIDPPRYLVCISVANHTHGVAQRSSTLGVHFLSSDQLRLAAPRP